MNIPMIQNSIPGADLQTPALPKEPGVGGEGFGSYLTSSLEQVNSLLTQADKSSVDMVAGKSENLHDAMIQFEKAESALKLLVQVRNKAIEAYHEVMRMQV